MERYIVQKKVSRQFCYHSSFPDEESALMVCRLITDAQSRVFDRKNRVHIQGAKTRGRKHNDSQ